MAAGVYSSYGGREHTWLQLRSIRWVDHAHEFFPAAVRHFLSDSGSDSRDRRAESPMPSSAGISGTEMNPDLPDSLFELPGK